MEAPTMAATVFLLGLTASLSLGNAYLLDDIEALIDFIVTVPHRRGVLNWTADTPICDSWTGVTCNNDQSNIIALQLPGIKLTGVIPPNTLSRLTSLHTLDLSSNYLSGPLPLEFLPSLSLTSLDLSFNFFNDSIPDSIRKFPNLVSLNLSDNLLSGNLPDIWLENLRFLNLSDNHLDGAIPYFFQKFPYSSFLGNNYFLNITSPSSLPPLFSPRGSNHNLFVIIAGVCVLVPTLIIILLLLIWYSRRRKSKNVVVMGGCSFSKNPIPVNNLSGESKKLAFSGSNGLRFDLDDLLRASAEVLGKGTYGMAYKVILEDSSVVVLKRVKDVGISKGEFDRQMELVEKIKHQNVVELLAYYYSKDEKLLVYDYYSLGSLSQLLHGEEYRSVDWELRLRIAHGVARGISHIHSLFDGRLVHGNITSSNILINHQFHGCISDVGITTITSHKPNRKCKNIAYQAPEIVKSLKLPTQMSDVYSFGVVLLEILTGKCPTQPMRTGYKEEEEEDDDDDDDDDDDGSEKGFGDLVKWVKSVVKEEWTGEVFDVDILRSPETEDEMVKVLQIAMACVLKVPNQRPRMSDVVTRIADIRSTVRASSDSTFPVEEISW